MRILFIGEADTERSLTRIGLRALIAAFDVTKNFLFALNSVNGVRYPTIFDARLCSRCVEPEIGRSSVTQ